MEAVGEIVSDEVTAGLHVAEASVEIAGEPVTDAAVAAQIAAQHAASTAQLHLSTVASDASAAVQMAMAAALAAGGAPVVPGSAPPFALGPQAAAQAASEAEKMANAKRPWTAEEDQLLLEAITKYGTQRWPLIAGYVQRGRAGKQCRERWFNHLSPTVKKGDWTEEEDAIIQQGVAELGTKWSEIVKRLPGRTDNSIKNRYNSQQRREQRRARAAANATRRRGRVVGRGRCGRGGGRLPADRAGARRVGGGRGGGGSEAHAPGRWSRRRRIGRRGAGGARPRVRAAPGMACNSCVGRSRVERRRREQRTDVKGDIEFIAAGIVYRSSRPQ